MEDGRIAIGSGLGPFDVATSALLGSHPHVEGRGSPDDRIGQEPQGVRVPVGFRQWRLRPLGATTGELDHHRRYPRFVARQGGRALPGERGDLVVEFEGHGVEHGLRENTQSCLDACDAPCPVEAVDEPRRRVVRHARCGAEGGVVLVHQGDECRPIPAVEERLVVGSEEHRGCIETPHLLADPPHEMDVRVVIELHGRTQTEVHCGDLRIDGCQIPTQLGLPRGGKRKQQQRVDARCHDLSLCHRRHRRKPAVKPGRRRPHMQRAFSRS